MSESIEELRERAETLEREVKHLRRIQECTSTLIESLDLGETLDTILNTAREVVGAAQGSILLYNEAHTHLRIVNAIGLREETVATTEIPDGKGISGRVAQSCEPILVEDIDADPRFQERRSRSNRSRSFACLPLPYKEKVLGAMNLSHPSEDSMFRGDSLPYLVALGQQAAVAIAHSEMHNSLIEKRSLDQQLEFARTVQESFIPPSIHITGGGYEFAGRNEAAKTVGGDFYDVTEATGGRYAFFLGDVSGKGMPAALYMARLFSDVHHAIGLNPEPEAVLASLNTSLCKRSHRGMFVTMTYGYTTPSEGTVSIASAGHLPPLLKSAEGPVIIVKPETGPPLGVDPASRYAATESVVNEGDLVLLYSDGVAESRSAEGKEFDIEGLSQALRNTGRSSTVVVDELLREVKAFATEGPIQDDITFLAVKNLSSLSS